MQAIAQSRVALIIGNGEYVNAPRLPNPRNDAEDVAASLKKVGFSTVVGLDLDKTGMEDATLRFARAARTADVAIFYYSGHALQFSGVNYLLPIDAKLSDETDLRRMTRVDEIVEDLQRAKNLRILVLDSCRDNPLADELKRSVGATRAVSVQRGLAKIDSPQGMIVSYATQAGRTAEDGIGRNSPYTSAFLKHIEKQDEIGTIFRRIGADVFESTGRTQLPELSLSFIGEFYLNGRGEISAAPRTADRCAVAADHWRSAETLDTLAAFEDHLARFSDCAFAGLAKARIERLREQRKPAVASSVPGSGAAATAVTSQPGPNPGVANSARPTAVAALPRADVSSTPSATALSFPTKPIALIVPWPAGGPTDIVMRSIAEAASQQLGQPIVIENKSGGGGTVGPAAMASASRPDGYTITQMPITVHRLPLMQNTTWNVDDFTHIVQLAGYVFAVVAGADTPFRKWQDVIDYARKNPGKLTYGSPGSGSSLHLGMELLAEKSGVKFTHVPFRGAAEVNAAVAGGQIMLGVSGTSSKPIVDAGKARFLNVWSATRVPYLPDVPTLQELGYPYVIDSPWGLAGPKGMDPRVVAKIHDAFKRALEQRSVIDSLARYDMLPNYKSPVEYVVAVREQIALDAVVLKRIGLERRN